MAIELNVDATLNSMEEHFLETASDDEVAFRLIDLVRGMITDLRASGQLIDHPPEPDRLKGL